jgi:ISXO2-like transposase domain/Transposase zinc-ribbon domain
MPTTDPATFADLAELFPDDDACARHLEALRWPDGFRCPRCASSEATRLSTRALWECRECRHQTSVTAGTALAHTKVPLRTWFYALWVFARRRKGTSALALQRETGIGCYATALYLLHKVRGVVAEAETAALHGTVEVDEAIIAGKNMRPGKRLGLNGAFLLAAVERVEFTDKKGRKRVCAGSARAAVIASTDADTVVDFVEETIQMGATVVSDGGAEFERVVYAGVDHESHPQHRTAAVSERHLKVVHIFYSNLKTWLVGIFHGVSRKHLPRYLDEYVYRYNRRRVGPPLFAAVVRRLLRAPWSGIVQISATAEGSR